jgi:hypothetical protein
MEFDAGMKLGCDRNSVSHSCGAKAEHCQRRGLDIPALYERIDRSDHASDPRRVQ